MATQPNSLRVNRVEEQARYRDAVAEIIRNIMADERTNLVTIADRIDVSLGTISNAFNGNADLTSLYLNRLGQVFGPHYLDPYARLAGGRMVPLDPEGGDDILPALMVVGSHIAQARAPASPGGVSETLREQLSYLPYLRRLLRDVEGLIHMIETRKDAA